MEENKEENKLNEEKLKELVSKGINKITQDGIQMKDLETLSQLVDIHKDLCNEDYWKVKKEAIEMRYPEYGRRNNYVRDNYNRRGRDSRGRYTNHGEEMMEEMFGAYNDYSNGREQMNMGNYGAKSETMKSLDYMMQSVVDFIEMLKKEANSQEEIQLISRYAEEISEI